MPRAAAVKYGGTRHAHDGERRHIADYDAGFIVSASAQDQDGGNVQFNCACDSFAGYIFVRCNAAQRVRLSSPVTGLMLIEVPPAAAAHGNTDAMNAHAIIGAQASRARKAEPSLNRV